MRIDERLTMIESETERLLGEIRTRLRGYRFRRLGNHQFHDLGKVYEQRGGPCARLFLQSKDRESRAGDERDELRKLMGVLELVDQSNLDIHMKAFILRKLLVVLS